MAAIWSMSRDHRPPGFPEAPNYIGGGNVMRCTTWNAHGPENACPGLMLMDKRFAFHWCAICHRTTDARARYSLCSYLCILLFEIDDCRFDSRLFVLVARDTFHRAVEEKWDVGGGHFFRFLEDFQKTMWMRIKYFSENFLRSKFSRNLILYNWKVICFIKI